MTLSHIHVIHKAGRGTMRVERDHRRALGSIQVATYREQLEELRDLLWDRLQSAGSRDTAPIAKQYRDTVATLEAMDTDVPREGSKLDELAEARRRRLANAESS